MVAAAQSGLVWQALREMENRPEQLVSLPRAGDSAEVSSGL